MQLCLGLLPSPTPLDHPHQPPGPRRDAVPACRSSAGSHAQPVPAQSAPGSPSCPLRPSLSSGAQSNASPAAVQAPGRTMAVFGQVERRVRAGVRVPKEEEQTVGADNRKGM